LHFFNVSTVCDVIFAPGAGFLGDGRTQVAINAAGCDIQNVSYTQVVCVTGAAGADWSGDILVQLISPDDELLTLTCDDVCVYSYSSASTPTLSSITPNAVSVLLANLLYTFQYSYLCLLLF